MCPRNQIATGFESEIFSCFTINENIAWINYIYDCYTNLKLRYGTLRQFSRKKGFIVPAQSQWTCVQRLSPKNKEVSPYISSQAGYRSKKQNSTHIWLHVTLLAISFSSLSFMSALPSLPLPNYQNIACLLLFWHSLLYYSQ
jgi:hypothetical protein